MATEAPIPDSAAVPPPAAAALQAPEAPSVRIATCSCGQLQARVTGAPIRVSVCHCYACQKRTGSTYGAQASFPPEAVQTSGRATEWVRVGDEGTHCHFFFCPECGATVYYRPADLPRIAIPVGAFADNTFPAPTFSVYEERMHSWVSVPEEAEHMW